MEKYINLENDFDYKKLKEPTEILKKRRNSSISNRDCIWHRRRWVK